MNIHTSYLLVCSCIMQVFQFVILGIVIKNVSLLFLLQLVTCCLVQLCLQMTCGICLERSDRYSIIRLHMKCGTYVFDSIEAAATAGSKMCYRIFLPALNITEIPVILCIHIPWVVWGAVQNFSVIAQDSTKWQPFSFEKITFLHLSPNLFSLFQQNLAGTLLGVRGTLSRNMTSNDLNLGKWHPFKGQNLHFCNFSGQISSKWHKNIFYDVW